MLGSNCYACGRQTWQESSNPPPPGPPPPPCPWTSFWPSTFSSRSFSWRRAVPSLGTNCHHIILIRVRIETHHFSKWCCQRLSPILYPLSSIWLNFIHFMIIVTYFGCCSHSQHLLFPSALPPSAHPPLRSLEKKSFDSNALRNSSNSATGIIGR